MVSRRSAPPVHVVEHVDRLDLGDTTFKQIDDPIAFAIRLELAIEREDNPVRVPVEQ